MSHWWHALLPVPGVPSSSQAKGRGKWYSSPWRVLHNYYAFHSSGRESSNTAERTFFTGVTNTPVLLLEVDDLQNSIKASFRY